MKIEGSYNETKVQYTREELKILYSDLAFALEVISAENSMQLKTVFNIPDHLFRSMRDLNAVCEQLNDITVTYGNTETMGQFSGTMLQVFCVGEESEGRRIMNWWPNSFALHFFLDAAFDGKYTRVFFE